MKARVYVTLRREVLDPQGKAVGNALRALGFEEVGDVRVGKYMELDLGGDRATEEERLKSMCDKLLANPVIEDYRFEIKEDGA